MGGVVFSLVSSARRLVGYGNRRRTFSRVVYFSIALY